MRVIIQDGFRNLCKNTVKAIFRTVFEFSKYWVEYQKQLEMNSRFPQPMEEVEKMARSQVDQIYQEYHENYEIIHFSDFGYAIEGCEREYILILSNQELVRSILVRMS